MKTTLCMIAAAAALSVCTPVMAGGDAAAGEEKAVVCFTCHGEDGLANTGSMPQPPKLAGQHRDYLLQSLEDYATGKRQSPIMAPFVANLSAEDIADLAAYFAALDSSLTLVESSD